MFNRTVYTSYMQFYRAAQPCGKCELLQGKKKWRKKKEKTQVGASVAGPHEGKGCSHEYSKEEERWVENHADN